MTPRNTGRLGLAGLLLLTACGAREATVQQVPCADIVAGCSLPPPGWQVRFDHAPRPMQRFRLQATLPGAGRVQARFMMRGMEMGLNQYRLQPDGTGGWRGEVMLPACIQGRSDWLLILDADGRRYALPFASDPGS